MPRRARLCLRPRLRAPRLRAAAPPLQAGDAPLRGARAMADAGPRTRLWRSGGPPALLARLRRDGFLLLRGLLPRGASCGARAAALEALRGGAAGPRAAAQLADPRPAAGGGHDDGEAAPGACAVGLLGCAAAAVLPAVASLLEHPALFALADLLLPPAASTTGGAVVTPAFKARGRRGAAGGKRPPSNPPSTPPPFSGFSFV